MSANDSYGVSGMKDVFNQTVIQGTPALSPSYLTRPAQPGTGEDGPAGCRGLGAPWVVSMLLAKRKPPKWKTGSGEG